ncbi:MAG: archease [Candidatus Promineifilaceae bacterium]
MASKPQKQPDNLTGYEIVEHTADWALRFWGRNLEELFTAAAIGMTRLMVADTSSLSLDVKREIELEAFDTETLLVDWLSELAYLAEDEGLVFRQFELKIRGTFRLSASVLGGKAEELVKHIKAVTYHDLDIKKGDCGLEATVVFDV